MPDGLVIAGHGNRITIEDDGGQRWQCHTHRSQGRIVCGDRVRWEPKSEGNAVVTERLPRKTELVRAGENGKSQLLCANIDQIVVVNDGGRRDGDLHLPLIDHHLIGAELIGIQAAIVINKLDLVDDAALGVIDSRLEPYRRIGYPCLLVSARSGRNMDALHTLLEGRSSILVGESGVGKSSLINRLIPDQEARVGDLTSDARHGRHTTTTTCLYRLEPDGCIIDSPGVRAFMPYLTDHEQVAKGFREFAPFLDRCRFRNCRHNGDAGCALAEAVAEGLIDGGRLERYRDLCQAIDEKGKNARPNSFPKM
ncbi:MAG: ribosome small subunit-dependent GTPase A [Gammaproteobacteria bacterium]|nr:ribosome small subunit-dependent GTPase A [Gammaproteobacteria bacterium]